MEALVTEEAYVAEEDQEEGAVLPPAIVESTGGAGEAEEGVETGLKHEQGIFCGLWSSIKRH